MSKHTFKPGDRVRIKGQAELEMCLHINPIMFLYCGKEATIQKNKGPFYSLDIDGDEWYWSDEMLEPITAASQGGESEGEGSAEYVLRKSLEDSARILHPQLGEAGYKKYADSYMTLIGQETTTAMHDFAAQQTAALRAELARTKKDCDHYITLSNTYLKSTSEALDDLAALRAENERLRVENAMLRRMIDEGVHWDDMKNDITYPPIET